MSILYEPLIAEGAKLWARLYQKHPAITLISTVIFLGIAGGTISVVVSIDQKRQEELRRESSTYTQQLTRLNQTEENLKQLIQFVSSQKETLRASEDAINALQKKHEEISPILEADKKALDAIFRVQDERARSAFWWQTSIGFVLGIIASYVAAFFWQVTRELKKRKTIQA